MPEVAERIRGKLNAALDPIELVILDQSERHAGHAGWQPGGETHFKIRVVSAAFVGKSRVERQRLVYGILAKELKERVHALELEVVAPAGS